MTRLSRRAKANTELAQTTRKIDRTTLQSTAKKKNIHSERRKRTKLSPPSPTSGPKKTKAEQTREYDKRLRTQLERQPCTSETNAGKRPEREGGREKERERERESMTKIPIRKECEANECGGRLEQKEIRRPTRYRKHKSKGEEE